MYRFLSSYSHKRIANENHLSHFKYIDIGQILHELWETGEIPLICEDIVSEIVSYIESLGISSYYIKENCYIDADNKAIELQLFRPSTQLTHIIHIYINKNNCDPYVLYLRRSYLKKYQDSSCFFYGNPNTTAFLIKEIFGNKNGITLLYFCEWDSTTKHVIIHGAFKKHSITNDHIVVHSSNGRQMLCIDPLQSISYFVCHKEMNIFNIHHLMQQTFEYLFSLFIHRHHSVKSNINHRKFMLYFGPRLDAIFRNSQFISPKSISWNDKRIILFTKRNRIYFIECDFINAYFPQSHQMDHNVINIIYVDILHFNSNYKLFCVYIDKNYQIFATYFDLDPNHCIPFLCRRNQRNTVYLMEINKKNTLDIQVLFDDILNVSMIEITIDKRNYYEFILNKESLQTKWRSSNYHNVKREMERINPFPIFIANKSEGVIQRSNDETIKKEYVAPDIGIDLFEMRALTKVVILGIGAITALYDITNIIRSSFNKSD